MFNPLAVFRSIGLANFIVNLVITICAVFMIVVIFSCLFWLIGF
jgi:hypothetical protein